MSNSLFPFLAMVLCSLLISSCESSAFAADRNNKKPVVRRSVPTPLPTIENRGKRPLQRDYPLPNTLAAKPVAASDLSVKPSSYSAPSPSRLIHARLQVAPLFEMLAQHDTRASFRADVDVIAGEKFSIGPSILYHQSSSQDLDALAGGNSLSLETSRLEVGLLSNVYVLGTTSTGGFLLRPHVYWISVKGEKQDGSGSVVSSGDATDGVRAGAEFLYQKILDVGFSFEVGGGFTYHVVPYSVGYTDGIGQQSVGPANRLQPTVTVGLGWAF